MPLAFFCTLFFRHRKKSVSAPWDGKSQSAPESARQAPSKGNFLRQSCLLSMQCRGLSSGQTIGAVRTAVRPACCLPELRGANRLRRLYPLDTRFPPFPPAHLRTVVGEKTWAFLGANNRRVRRPPRGFLKTEVSLCGASMCFPQYTPHPQKTTGMFPNTPVVFR